MTEIEGGNEGPDVGDLPAGRGGELCHLRGTYSSCGESVGAWDIPVCVGSAPRCNNDLI